MKKIINKNKVRLVFPKYDLSIDSNEIKEVTEEQFNGVIQNSSIEEVIKKEVIDHVEKDNVEYNRKGRKTKNY